MTPSVIYGQATSNSAASVAVANNAAMVSKDLRLVWISVSNTTSDTPAGWELLLTYTLATSRNGYVFRRRHPGAGETSHTFTFGAANNFGMVQAGVRGADLGALDFTPTSNSAASGTTLTANGGTTLRNDSLLLAAFHLLLNGTGETLSTPSGMTSEIFQAGTGSAGHAVGLFSEVDAAAGSTGSRASTASNSGPWGATLLAVAPRVILPDSQPHTSRRRAALI